MHNKSTKIIIYHQKNLLLTQKMYLMY